MPHQTQAELFIRTLADMRDEDRGRRDAQMRLQHKAHAERFLEAFRGGVHASGRSADWTPPGTRSDHPTMSRIFGK